MLDRAMAVASSASVSQITAVSTSSVVRSSRRLKSTPVVSFSIKNVSHGFGYGCSSSTFFASETPFSFVALGVEKAADESDMKSCTYFSDF